MYQDSKTNNTKNNSRNRKINKSVGSPFSGGQKIILREPDVFVSSLLKVIYRTAAIIIDAIAKWIRS